MRWWVHCPNCLTKEHRDGTITYYHNALLPVVVVPGSSRVIPLAPEFIRPRDGKEKQDCENAAGKRWIGNHHFRGRSVCKTAHLPGGFGQKPQFYLCLSAHQSHKTLSEWLTAADPVEDLHKFSVTQWTGKEHLTYTYQYANGVPLKDGEDALLVNWAQLTDRQHPS
ncbi:MAG: hypothetical protein FVQ80_16455 [Planctomycetes bacterium]|nr:hypothetical protein [Planctomycetota bacterium]